MEPPDGEKYFGTEVSEILHSLRDVDGKIEDGGDGEIGRSDGLGDLIAGETVVRSVLISDIVKSTDLIRALGNVRASKLFARDDAAISNLAEEYNGRVIDKSDGVLLLFERPWMAVLFAVSYHRFLRGLDVRFRDDLKAYDLKIGTRIGIHLNATSVAGSRGGPSASLLSLLPSTSPRRCWR